MATAAQVALVESSVLQVDCRLEIVDSNGNVTDDITEWLEDGQVEHRNFRTIHRTISLTLGRELAWGRERVRPTMILTAPDGTSDEVALGTFMLTAPSYTRGETPKVFEVIGYDLLYLLDQTLDRTVYLQASAGALNNVRALLDERGFARERLSLAAEGESLTSPYVAPITDQQTWLQLINRVLESVGYRSLNMGADGVPESEPYVSPTDASPMWTYDLTSSTTNVSDSGVLTDDYTDVPNVWTVVRADSSLGRPVENDGLVRLINQSEGPTSIDERGGYTFPRPLESFEAASQAALLAYAERIKAEDMRRLRYLEMTTGPNPYHGHFDTVDISDPGDVSGGRWQHVAWTLPLLGGEMTHELRSVT